MQQLENSLAAKDAEFILGHLKTLPEAVASPVLVVVAGLPGSGKSYFSRKLAERVPLLILETDNMRRILFNEPTHTLEESARLFQACHQLIYNLLKQGIPVLFDATNLVEAHRAYLYRIADQLGVKLVLVFLRAPLEVVHKRLQKRVAGQAQQDHSTAGPEVYERMRASFEPTKRNHFVVDTSKDVGPALEKVVREIKKGMRSR